MRLRSLAIAAPLALAAPLFAGPAPATAPPAPPALAALADDGRLRVHVGSAGDGGAEPTYREVLVRDADGRWSRPAPLPFPRPGLPLQHRDVTWILENREGIDGRRWHALLPVSGEPGLPGVRLEHVQDQRGAAALNSLDDWTFVVAELGPGSHVFARVIVSHGSSMEMEVVREAVWRAAWPEETGLLATGVAGSLLMVVARAGDELLVSAHDDQGSADLPALAVTGLSPVAACVTPDGPVVVGARGASLVARAWSGEGWGPERVLALPGGRQASALSVAALGDGNDAYAIALVSSEPRILVGAALSGGAWSEPERVTAEPATVAPRRGPSADPSPREAEAQSGRLRRLRWGIVLAAFPVLVLLLRHLARLRR